MSSKLIFLDIDGTLLDHDKNLPPSAKQAIGKLQEDGHEVAIATGRGPFMFKKLREELGITSYVSYNGQYVVRKGELIYCNPIPKDALARIAQAAAARHHPIVFMNEETMRTSDSYHAYVVESIASLKVATPELDPLFYEERDIYQCLLFCLANEEAAYRAQFDALDFIRWHTYSMDILPAGGSKAAGIANYLRHSGHDREEIYAFGDYYNDLEMLQFAGHSVAMGNAPEEVKQAARYVTRDVAEGGLAYGFSLVGLLKQPN